MLYGFGDDENPYQESVELLEDLVIWFIQNMVCFVLFIYDLFIMIINKFE